MFSYTTTQHFMPHSTFIHPTTPRYNHTNNNYEQMYIN